MAANGEKAPFDREFAEALCDLEIPQSIQFSSCGTKILYETTLTWSHAKGKNPASTLWLAKPGQEGSSRQLTSGLFEDRHARWLPDGKRIAFISDRPNAGKNSAVWILTVGEDGGGEPYPITAADNEQRIETFSISPDGLTIAFESADEKTAEQKQEDEDEETGPQVWGEEWENAHLRTVDINSKEVTTLTEATRHVSNVCWSPDGSRLAYQHAESTDIEEPGITGTVISVANKDGSQAKDLCTIHNLELNELAWGKDGKIYFVTGFPSHMESAGVAAYAMDPDSESPKYNRVAGGVEADVYKLLLCGDEVIVSLEDRLDTRLHVIKKDGSANYDVYRKDTNIDAFDVFFGPSGGSPLIAAALSDVNNPFEVFTIQDGKLTQLSNHGLYFKDRTLGSCTVLTCQSADGEVELDGLYLSPSSELHGHKPKHPLPTFVMMHGGPADRNTNRFDAHYYMWAPYILSKGYGVLLPQYRGSRGRGEKFAMYSIGAGGVYDYADIVTITDNAISQGFADSGKLLIGGYSQGGVLTYLCSVRNGLHGLGWRYNAAIAGAGICDMDALSGSSEVGATFDVEISAGKAVWSVGPEDTRNRKGSALYEVAGAVRAAKEGNKMVIPPMLFLHGEEDVTCPFTQATAFRRALRAHQLPHEFVSYPRQEHFIKEQKFWLDMLERIGRWCDKYIGPGSDVQ